MSMSTRPKSEQMSTPPSPPPSDRRAAAMEEIRRGTRLAELLRQQVELMPEDGRRDAAVANVGEISRAMESSLFILQSESEHSSSEAGVLLAVTPTAAYSPDGGAGARNCSVARSRKARHRRGSHGEELPIKEMLTQAPENDGFNWRKYGEKKILNAEYPRLYYKCGYGDDHRCPAKKYVQQQNNSVHPLFMVTLINEHTCDTLFPAEPSSSSRGASQVLDFTSASRSPSIMAGAPGLKQEEETSMSGSMQSYGYGYGEPSSSLPSLSPEGDRVDFFPGPW